jgi:hypothetical protein
MGASADRSQPLHPVPRAAIPHHRQAQSRDRDRPGAVRESREGAARQGLLFSINERILISYLTLGDDRPPKIFANSAGSAFLTLYRGGSVRMAPFADRVRPAWLVQFSTAASEAA